jgi:hypothetical protein
LWQHNFQTEAKALQATLQLEDNQYKHIDPAIEELRVDLNNMTFQWNQNKGKEKREVVWCTLCITKINHKNECPTFVQYLGEVPYPHEDHGVKYVEHMDMIPIIVP